jgi:rod shape-determining protein MreC
MDWPPPSRRASQGRREQNLALISAVVSGIVVTIALVLLFLSRADPELGGRARGTALDIVAPVWSVIRAPFDWLSDVGDTIGDYVGTVPHNRILTAELAAARQELEHMDVLQAENVALRKLLKVVEPQQRLIAVARIAGSSTGSYARTAMLSAGHDDGVFAGQPVRGDSGLLGRTVEVGSHAERVMLLTDPNSRVPVLIVRTGQPALAVGANGRLLEVRDRLGAEAPLLVGDRLVTSGAGGIFAPQIPVAVIVDGGREPPLAEPYANPATLTHVAIYAPYLPVPLLADPAAKAAATPVPREAGKRAARAGPKPGPKPTAAATLR